ncbi:MAG: DUF1549 domain-containing protein, partial [Planctomycetota bacterium]|nr:DUF1549 domain-containing protein [Planctomycetota bacterium]
MRRLPLLILTLLGGALASGLRSSEARAPSPEEGEVDFLRQVRPILADKCFACHGPDESTREADLRLDTREGLFGDLGGYAAVTPGDLDASEIIYRVSNEDEAERMPPAETGKQLTAEEIEVIRRWIEDGAEWNTHWAFEAPTRPEPPAVSDESWPRNEIDRFVLARLEAEGLAPAPEADKEELLRRVTFDLTGLPPTLGEIDAFLLDTGEDAYEKVVDRLLASPRYGERQAQEWLDLARFADSNGDGYDGTRQMWKWREWVIQAFNGNKPFDEFTIEQIAGDLLPDATRDQRLATGFHRNHTIFTKGGQAPDEYRHAYVIDRVNTTATVWMGLTLGCAQCHDHKYDPFSQKDYYRLYAYFNNVSESDVGRGNGNSPPYMHVPDDEQAVKLDELAAGIETLEAELTADHAEWDAAEAAWVDETLGRMETERVEWTTLEPSGFLSLGGSLLKRLDDGSFLATGPNPAQEVYHLVAHPGKGRITAFRLEVLPQESFPKGGSGRSEKGRFTLSEFEVYLSSVAQGDDGEKIRFHRAEDDVQPERSIDADKAVDGSKSTGWGLIGDEITSDHQAIFLPVEPLELNQNSVLRFVLDQKFRYRYRNTIGRFRISYTDDDDIVKRRLKVVPSTWRALGPFAAKTREEAFTTAFDPEQDIPEGVDLDKKYVKILLEDEKEKGPKGGGKKADEAAPSAAAPAAEPADEREPDPEDFADFDFEDFADF